MLAGDAQGRLKLQMLLSEGQSLAAKGRLAESLAIAQRMLDLATQEGDEAFVGVAHWRIGHVENILGRLQEAEHQFEWLLAWLTPEWQTELCEAIGNGLLPHVLSFSALNQWLLGYAEHAQVRINQAVTGELERRDLYGQAFASGISCTVSFLLRNDRERLQERSEMGLRLCRQQGFTMWQPYAEVFHGWLAVMHGEFVAGVEHMLHGAKQQHSFPARLEFHLPGTLAR